MEVLSLERTLTELDHVRLLNLARRLGGADSAPASCAAIQDVLDACAIVPSRQAPPDLVTMHSQVVLRDVDSGVRSTLTLCYPATADAATGRVSVLSPIGTALLGMRAGAVARWPTPAGEERAAEIEAIVFQPEHSGDFTS